MNNLNKKELIFVTGGAGFIGAHFLLEAAKANCALVNLDLLTYSGNIDNLASLSKNPDYHFVQGNIADCALVTSLLEKHRPRAIVHFAAESHVDRSIAKADPFIDTNIVGTYHLLEAARKYWSQLEDTEKDRFRFLHVSTDEVYGSLGEKAPAFTEQSLYQPNSPYSASKAASDHLVRAWHHTYGLPTIISHCSNNYGPFQFCEKLIPRMITQALEGKILPVYGDGKNIRDWLFVGDHCQALLRILEKGKVGENYNIGGNNEKTNLEIVKSICNLLDERVPRRLGSYHELIRFVKDRPGHDKRYAIDSSKIQAELGW
jgi:dTDP-glucose 4,6-dehydratase